MRAGVIGVVAVALTSSACAFDAPYNPAPVVPYVAPVLPPPSPLADIDWAFVSCDGDGDAVLCRANVGRGVLPIPSSRVQLVDTDWGDGKADRQLGNASRHPYTTGGVYTIQMRATWLTDQGETVISPTALTTIKVVVAPALQ